MTGGVYHPALGEIVESRIMLKEMLRQMQSLGGSRFVLYTDRKNISLVSGHKGANKQYLLNMGYTFKIKERQGCYLKAEKAEQ